MTQMRCLKLLRCKSYFVVLFPNHQHTGQQLIRVVLAEGENGLAGTQ